MAKKKAYKLELSQTKRPNRVQFLVLKGQIKDHLDRGYTGKDIWLELKKKKQINYKYAMFMRYVKQFITEPQKADRNGSVKSAEGAQKEPSPYSPQDAHKLI